MIQPMKSGGPQNPKNWNINMGFAEETWNILKPHQKGIPVWDSVLTGKNRRKKAEKQLGRLVDSQ